MTCIYIIKSVLRMHQLTVGGEITQRPATLLADADVARVLPHRRKDDLHAAALGHQHLVRGCNEHTRRNQIEERGQ